MSNDPQSPARPETPAAPNRALDIGRDIVRERFFFFLVLALLAVLTWLLIWPNLTAILTALALVVIIKPLYNWFLRRKWIAGKTTRATVVTLLAFIFLIALPIVLFIWMATAQATALLTDPLTANLIAVDRLSVRFAEIMAQVSAQEVGEFDLVAIAGQLQETVAALGSWLGEALVQVGGWLVQFFVGVVIVLVIMMVLLPRFETPQQDQMAVLIPFPPDITNLYLEKIQLMIVAMFKGTFVLAILQGLAMGVVLFIAGVPYVFFLTVASMVLALLPMIGISLLAWPIGILLILYGQVWQGVFVILAFILLVANIDTVLRPVLVPKGAYLNPALVMLSVFGGLRLMGLIGVIYGPVIMILLVTSIEVYAKYIMRSDLEPFLAEDGSLDLEKLGLREKEGERNKTGSLYQVMQRAGGLLSRKQDTE